MTELQVIDRTEVALGAAARDVLETMFFTVVVQEDEAPVEGEEGHEAVVRLPFRGSPTGSLRVSLNESAARAMASIFLRADEDRLTREQVDGVLCELATIVCGAALSRLENDASFRLGKPKAWRETRRRGLKPGECRLPLECGWIRLHLSIPSHR